MTIQDFQVPDLPREDEQVRLELDEQDRADQELLDRIEAERLVYARGF